MDTMAPGLPAEQKDNDDDGDIDYPGDTGCGKRNDNDETNCGDGVCEGGEVCDVCVSDCGYCTFCGDGFCEGNEDCNNCKTDCGQCDSCSDTDGFDPFSSGNVSGYSGGSQYSQLDVCDGDFLMEWYCSGTSPSSWPYECTHLFGNETLGTCSNNACVPV